MVLPDAVSDLSPLCFKRQFTVLRVYHDLLLWRASEWGDEDARAGVTTAVRATCSR